MINFNFINKHKYKIFFVSISFLIMILLFFLISILNNEKNKFKKGVYIRKQFCQFVVHGEEKINFTFYSVKNANYDFLNWNLDLKNDDSHIFKVQRKNFNKEKINKFIEKIEFDILIKSSDQLNGNQINTISFNDGIKKVNVEIGKILIYQIPSDKYISGKLVIATNTNPSDNSVSFSFTNENDGDTLIKEILLNNKTYFNNRALKKDETVIIKFNFEDLLVDHFNYKMIFSPYIKIVENDTIYFSRPGFNIIYNSLSDENEINNFIRNSNPFLVS